MRLSHRNCLSFGASALLSLLALALALAGNAGSQEPDLIVHE